MHMDVQLYSIGSARIIRDVIKLQSHLTDKFQMSPVGGKVQIKLVGSDPLLYLSVFENPLGSVARRPKFHTLVS